VVRVNTTLVVVFEALRLHPLR